MLDVIRKYARLPFDYDGADCCDFVGECLEALGHENYSNRFPRWTERGAKSYLIQYRGLDNLLRALFGDPVSGPNYQDGDIALVKQNYEYVAGIFYRDRILVRVPSGVMDLPPDRAAKVYRCPA